MTRAKDLLRRLSEDRLTAVTTAMGFLLILASLVVPLIPALDPNAQDLAARLAAPTWLGGEGGLLGTDELGRDVALRILYGLRTTFFIAVAAVIVGMFLGVAAGLSAGYFGGWWDSLIMRIADVQLSLPALMVIMAVVALLGGGPLVLVLVLGLNAWMLYARMVRGFVLRQRESDFVSSLEAVGVSNRGILWRHLLPNAMPGIFAISSLELPRLMLGEATLSFLGFGVKQPTISLGVILSGGRSYIADQWWLSTFSGLALAMAVLSTNLLGSWLEEQSSPLQRSP